MLSTPLNETALYDCLERLVPDICGQASEIASVQCAHSEYSSSYATYVVTVRLRTGDERRVFLKSFGFTQVVKDERELRRDRELRVYRDLLTGTDLGTPEYYGSIWDESQNRFWLLLEFLNGTEVRYCEIEHWIAAAAWVGRLQARFRQHVGRLRECEFLLRHTTEFFQKKADLALREVYQFSTSLGQRLVNILKNYDRLVEIMVRQPQTLVHGAYRPQNIFVEINGHPTGRVCAIDWELASLGSTLYDLAFFSDGFKPPELDRMFDVYRQEAIGVPVPARQEMGYVVDCFRFYRTINWLSRANQKRFTEDVVARLIDRGEQLRTLVF
jgi:thiamine kinase-like enzyme